MIRKALFLLAAWVSCCSAYGQISAYGTVTLNHMTGIASSPVLQTLSPPPCTSSLTTNCTAYRNEVNPIGFTGGITYGFKKVGPVLLSADARGVVEDNHQGGQRYAQGAGTRIYSVLGGVKATFRTPVSFVAPYVQGSFGYARSNYGVLTNAQVSQTPIYPGVPTQNNLQYSGFAGVDLKVLPYADFRVVEVGYGALQGRGSFGHTYPILSISSGIVVHFPPR